MRFAPGLFTSTSSVPTPGGRSGVSLDPAGPGSGIRF